MEQLTHDVIENVAENESEIIVGNDWSDEDLLPHEWDDSDWD